MVLYVNMDNTVMDALYIFPADPKQLEVEAIFVDNNLVLVFCPFTDGLESRMFLKDLYDLFYVCSYFIHWSMLFVLTLTTKIFKPSSEMASSTIR